MAGIEKVEEDARALIEFEKVRFDLAWRHFEFHARQRTTMFHFFVLIVPFLFGGFFYLLKPDAFQGASPVAAMLVGIIGLVLSIVFALLDQRNQQLYRVSQQNLVLIEKILYLPGFRPLQYQDNNGNQAEFRGTFTEEKARHGRNCLWRHALLLPAIYLLAGVLFLGLSGYAYQKWMEQSPRGVLENKSNQQPARPEPPANKK